MFLRVGHRGACALHPENTLASFDAALKLGCTAVEFDVHQCATGEMVVIHDSTLERTTNGKGEVAEKTLAQLQKLDAGKGEKIPTLQEVFERYKNQATLLIEAKGKTDAAARRLVSDIHAAVHTGWEPSKLVVIGFHPKVLHWVRLAAPEIALGLNYEEPSEEGDFESLKPVIESLKVQYFNPEFKILDAEMMRYTKEHRLKVVTWGAAKKADVAQATKLGVDGVMADDPGIFD